MGDSEVDIGLRNVPQSISFAYILIYSQVFHSPIFYKRTMRKPNQNGFNRLYVHSSWKDCADERREVRWYANERRTKMTKVIGLFDDVETQEVIDALAEQGLADNYTLIDKDNLVEERILAVPPGSTAGGSVAASGAGAMPVIGTNQVVPGSAEDETSRNVSDFTLDNLTDYGISESEAAYYAQNIEQGAELLIVEVNETQADQVEDLMREAGAQNLQEE